jgi:hypothetical protein
MIVWSHVQTRPANHGHHLNNQRYKISCEEKTKAKSTQITYHNIEIIGEYNERIIAEFT